MMEDNQAACFYNINGLILLLSATSLLANAQPANKILVPFGM